MPRNSRTAEQWVETTVRDHFRGALIVAATYVLIAFAGLVLWFGVTFGLMFIFSFVLVAIGTGISMNYVLLVWALQLLLYPKVRRKEDGEWEVARDVDGNVYVTKPDGGSKTDTAFSNRSILASLFFAVPLALDVSWRQIVQAMRIRKVDREPLAKLVDVLISEQRKVTFDDLAQRMSDDTLYRALDAARRLPEFQFFATEPQGVALTGNAIDGALTAA